MVSRMETSRLEHVSSLLRREIYYIWKINYQCIFTSYLYRACVLYTKNNCLVANLFLEHMKKGTYLTKVRKKGFRRFYALDNESITVAYNDSKKPPCTADADNGRGMWILTCYFQTCIMHVHTAWHCMCSPCCCWRPWKPWIICVVGCGSKHMLQRRVTLSPSRYAL